MKKITSHPVVRNGHNIVLTIASILLVTTLFYVAFFASDTNNAKAGVNDTLSGWAWSDNIGWISFNCIDTSSCGTVDYSVDMAVNGDLSGYAWSDNIGWISFNDSAGCSQNPCQPKLTGNNLQGWARALSYGDGWDGWVSLNGVALDGANYGVVFNNSAFEGFAWDASDISGDAIGTGWIKFNPVFGGVVITPVDIPSVTLTANPISVSSGQNSTLTWSSSNATTCEASVGWSGTKEISGSEVVGPHAIDTVYRLTCSNTTSQASNDATVFVTIGGGGNSQCSDGVDNVDVEDVLVDANDPGCYDSGAYDPNDTNETNALLPQCSNFFDDDGDGKIDYKADGSGDSGCSDANDNREQDFIFEEY